MKEIKVFQKEMITELGWQPYLYMIGLIGMGILVTTNLDTPAWLGAFVGFIFSMLVNGYFIVFHLMKDRKKHIKLLQSDKFTNLRSLGFKLDEDLEFRAIIKGYHVKIFTMFDLPMVNGVTNVYSIYSPYKFDIQKLGKYYESKHSDKNSKGNISYADNQACETAYDNDFDEIPKKINAMLAEMKQLELKPMSLKEYEKLDNERTTNY
jgi:hypothetical protein